MTSEDDHASETATERAAQLAETAADNEQVDAQGQVATDGGLEVDQTAAAEGSTDGFSRTVEQGGGAVHVAEPTAARVVERLRIRWGCNNSKKYDGKVEDVPAQWVIDGSLADSEHRERKNLGWDSDGDIIPAKSSGLGSPH